MTLEKQFKSSVLLACGFPTVINIINPFCSHHFYHQRTFIKCLLGDGTLQGEAGRQSVPLVFRGLKQRLSLIGAFDHKILLLFGEIRGKHTVEKKKFLR